MDWIARCFHIPASETQKSIVIAASIVVMGMMAVGLVWQAEVSRWVLVAIRWLETVKFGG